MVEGVALSVHIECDARHWRQMLWYDRRLMAGGSRLDFDAIRPTTCGRSACSSGVRASPGSRSRSGWGSPCAVPSRPRPTSGPIAATSREAGSTAPAGRHPVGVERPPRPDRRRRGHQRAADRVRHRPLTRSTASSPRGGWAPRQRRLGRSQWVDRLGRPRPVPRGRTGGGVARPTAVPAGHRRRRGTTVHDRDDRPPHPWAERCAPLPRRGRAEWNTAGRAVARSDRPAPAGRPRPPRGRPSDRVGPGPSSPSATSVGSADIRLDGVAP